jgi:hypothetical protein
LIIFAASHSVFDQVQYVYIGGRLDASNNIMNPFSGIIGGKKKKFLDCVLLDNC